jgi:hypothetical protein
MPIVTQNKLSHEKIHLLTYKIKSMSEHARLAMLDNIQQNLIDIMADYLESDSLKLDEMIALIKDPVKSDESELHIRMANAAFEEYKKTVVSIDSPLTTQP